MNDDFPSLAIDHDNPHAWVQWKGTDVCADLRCECGYASHIDGWFAYHVKCPSCGQVYEMDGHINLIKLNHEPKGTQVAE